MLRHGRHLGFDRTGVSQVLSRVDSRGNDGTGCFRIEVRKDTTEFMDMRIAGLEIDEIWSQKVRFIEIKTKVASRKNGTE